MAVTGADDPRERIAELERQLAEQKRINELESQLAEAKSDARDDNSDVALLDRPVPGRKRSFGWMIPALGLCVVLAAALTAMAPSTVLWTSGILCRAPYQLDYRRSETVVGNSHSYGSSFQCVSDADSHGVNQFAVMGLQLLPLVLVVCAIAVLIWLRRRVHPTEFIPYPRIV